VGRASSLNGACGSLGFIGPIIPYFAMPHTGYTINVLRIPDIKWADEGSPSFSRLPALLRFHLYGGKGHSVTFRMQSYVQQSWNILPAHDMFITEGRILYREPKHCQSIFSV